MSKKKFLMHTIIGIMVLSLFAGCSSGNSKQAGSADKGGDKNKTTTITMLFADSLLGGIHEELVKEFEASHPGIKVKAESLPDGGIFDALRVRVTSQEMPDLFQINIGHVSASMAEEAGYIYDLKDMESMQNYAASIKEASTINGKIANFSLGVGVLGLPYNKKALAELGYNEPFKTWDEMMAAGKKLKDQGQDLLVYASKWETSIANVFHWTFGYASLKDPEFKKAYLSNSIDWSKPGYTDILAEGFKKFKELNTYVRTGSFTNEYSIAQQAFANEETPMVLGGTWEAGTYRQLNENLDLGFMNLPYAPENENPYIFVPEDGLAINAKSDHLEAAKTLANWLFSQEVYAKIQKAKGSMSAITGVGELDPSYEDVPNWLNTDRVISFANTGPIPGPTWVALGEAAQQYTFDDDLDAAIQRFVAEYNKTKAN